MTTPWDALTAMLAADATSPRLTWYGGDGERVELSAKVLHNWASKAADLLQAEADLDGGVVVLDLPAGHWRAFYWALAAWACGASVTLRPAASAATPEGDVLVTTAPAARFAGPLQIVVNPAVLARAAAVEVPPGAIDEAAELATYSDVFVPVAIPAPGDVALVDGPSTWTFAEMATPRTGPAGRRHLDAATGAAEVLRGAVATWAGGGSVVVTTAGDPEPLRRILASEGVTGA